MTSTAPHHLPPYIPQPPRPGSGMAIAALVISIISLLLCWVPIVNNLFFFTAVLSLVLGLVAARRAKKGRAGGRGMAVAAAVMSIVAILGVISTQLLYSAILDEVGQELDEASDEFEDGLDGDSAKSGEDARREREAEVLDLGAVAKVGEYRVSVTRVDTSAAALIAAENEFNEKAEGRYVMATIDVTYQGSEEGDPWLDLSPTLAGSDSRNYDTSTCSAVIPEGAMDVPTLTNGGQATYNVCFDVPAAALGGSPTLFVEESLSFDGDRVFWAVG